jgi:pimeloyl-ACP methyl ester carboxylesterase
MHRPSRKRFAALSGVGALIAAAAIAVPAISASNMPAFYTPPGALPAANGALVRSEPMKLGVAVQLPFSTTTLPGKATRIMYKSTDSNGQPVAVTGTYIEPSKAWTGAGPRPLVTYAEGTQGQGDKCAPSLGLENPVGLNSGATNIGYEVPNIYNLLNRGFAVVVTDYVGLGTTDRIHTYVNRVDQGHAVLDAARAALQVPGASVTSASPVGAYGYSQGGGATASAAELAPTYAPDVNLKGVYAGAPPADLSAVMKTADGTSLTGVIGFAVNGFAQSYPQIQSVLNANTNAAGKAALAALSTECIGNAISTAGYKKTSTWTTTGQTISQVVAANPVAQAVVDAQKIGRIEPQVPVRITSGTLDDIVTHSQVKQLATDWCALGANVQYVPVKQLIGSGGSALNHLGPSITDGGAAQQWLANRLAGIPNQSNCSAIPSLG